MAAAAVLNTACLAGILDLAEEDGQRTELIEPFVRTVELGLQRSIRLEGINGSIHLHGSADFDRVGIDAIRRVRSDLLADAEGQLEYLQIFVWNDPDQILIQTVQPEASLNVEYEVDYHVTVPPHLNVEIFNANGSVRIEGLASDLWVETLNGDVFLRDVSGSTWVEVANGTVDSEVHFPEGGQLVHSVGNGGVRVKIQDSASAALSARVENGSIDLEGLELSRRLRDGGSVSGVLGLGQGLIDIAVANGWIEVEGR
jgi:hypothetical protein